jgi:hypothetical protein
MDFVSRLSVDIYIYDQQQRSVFGSASFRVGCVAIALITAVK